MNSGDQNYKRLWYYTLSDILYDYGQRTDQDLMSDGWVVDGITPIGNDYYNIQLHQKESEAGAALLLNSAEREYKVLYLFCDKGEHSIYDELHYTSQYEWMPYLWDETTAMVSIPFPEIYESSTYTVINAAVTAYEKETGYGGNGK